MIRRKNGESAPTKKKSIHIIFIKRRTVFHPVSVNGALVPVRMEIEYLGNDLGKRLSWNQLIQSERKQLVLKFWRLYSCIGSLE